MTLRQSPSLAASVGTKLTAARAAALPLVFVALLAMLSALPSGAACDGGHGAACSNLGYMYYSADGMPHDRDEGLALLKRSCDLGFDNGCRWYSEDKGN